MLDSHFQARENVSYVLRDKNGKVLNLRQVLIDKDHPARPWVWDELLVLSAAMLPKKA